MTTKRSIENRLDNLDGDEGRGDDDAVMWVFSFTEDRYTDDEVDALRYDRALRRGLGPIETVEEEDLVDYFNRVDTTLEDVDHDLSRVDVVRYAGSRWRGEDRQGSASHVDVSPDALDDVVGRIAKMGDGG